MPSNVEFSGDGKRSLVTSTANVGLRFIAAPQKKLMAQPLSRLGFRLAEEEREQKDDGLNQLLVAQLKLDCQFQHGISPVYAGSAANWLGLAICYTPLHGVALGLPRMALSSSKGFSSGSKLCGLRFYRGSTRHTTNALRFPHLKPCSCTAAWVTSPSSFSRKRLCAGDIFDET